MTPPALLVVCAANICRSPAAASLLREELVDQGAAVNVRSAGLTARGGRPACDLALSLVGSFASRRYAFEGEEQVGAHLSRRMTADDLTDDPLVLVMERWHADAVLALRPSARVRLLDPHADIPDPHAIGYQSHAWVFERLRAAVRTLATELSGG